jgi:hypothetical protein
LLLLLLFPGLCRITGNGEGQERFVPQVFRACRLPGDSNNVIFHVFIFLSSIYVVQFKIIKSQWRLSEPSAVRHSFNCYQYVICVFYHHVISSPNVDCRHPLNCRTSVHFSLHCQLSPPCQLSLPFYLFSTCCLIDLRISNWNWKHIRHITYRGSRGLLGWFTGICKRKVASVRPLARVYRHGCLRRVNAYSYTSIPEINSTYKLWKEWWPVLGYVLVFAKQCSTQTSDTSLQVDITWKIIPYFAFVDFPLFTIRIKSELFKDSVAPHHWQKFRAR